MMVDDEMKYFIYHVLDGLSIHLSNVPKLLGEIKSEIREINGR